jgi:cytoskeleton protein RodZ
MTVTPVYLLTIPGNSTVQISQDELRSLLGQIETELHRSKVYRRALATLQQLLGASADQAKVLFKAVGREAIGLAFQQFAQHEQKAAEPEASQTPTIQPTIQPSIQQTNITEFSSETPQGPYCDIFQKINTEAKASESNSPAKFQSNVIENTSKKTVKIQEDSSSIKTALRWFKGNKKPSKAEIAKQKAAEQRLETLRQIGQQLRQARESQGLSLSQLNVYTHVPIHQMEAVENANVELLPEDVFVRGFIRVMGNALALNGTVLAASLPTGEPVKSILPPWYQSHNRPKPGLLSSLEANSMYLYMGYTALVAGAVGGLSLVSQQQANADKAHNPDIVIPPSSSLFKSSEKSEASAKPGIKSSSSASVSIGSDIAPPEAL